VPDHPDAEHEVKPIVGRVERDEIRAALLVELYSERAPVRLA
jgi:hypothetical protein